MYRVRDEFRRRGFDEEIVLSLICSRLFHLQVFMSFGEIDSSRAFSKLTHTRLASLRLLAPSALRGRKPVLDHVRAWVMRLVERGTENNEDDDWNIEASWSFLYGMSGPDMRAVLRNLSHVHQNETILALFPGGLVGREDEWFLRWCAARSRVEKLAARS